MSRDFVRLKWRWHDSWLLFKGLNRYTGLLRPIVLRTDSATKLFKAGLLQKGALLPTRDGAKYCNFANISPILLDIFYTYNMQLCNLITLSRKRKNTKVTTKTKVNNFAAPLSILLQRGFSRIKTMKLFMSEESGGRTDIKTVGWYTAIRLYNILALSPFS